MKPILVRIELGPVDGPMPNFTPVVEEYAGKANAAGVPVRPAMKVTDVLEHPEAWGVAPGSEGYVAFLGVTTERDDAVEVLSAITVTPRAVIGVKVLSPTEVDEFQAQARRIVELRKQRQQEASRGRHTARANTAATAPSLSPTGSTTMLGEPYELALSTPEDAPKSPLDILNLVR